MKKIICIIILITLAITGCSKSVNRKQETEKNSESVNFYTNSYERIIDNFKGNDGGFLFYTDTSATLYYTYSYLETIELSDREIKNAEDVKTWLSYLDTEIFFDQSTYDSIKNIYYYVKIADFVNYDIEDNLKSKLASTVRSLKNKDSLYYLSVKHMNESDDQFEAMVLLSNTYAVEIADLLGMEISYDEKFDEWLNKLAYFDHNSQSKVVSYFNTCIDISKTLERNIDKFRPRAYEILSEYNIDYNKASFFELYSYIKLCQTYDFEKKFYSEREFSEAIAQYLSKDKLYSNQIGNYESGGIYATNLAAKIQNIKDSVLISSDAIEQIYSRQQRNGSFNDELDGTSDLYNTYYASKVIEELNLLYKYESDLSKYIKTISTKYEELSAYEKLMYLDLKKILNIESMYDRERVNGIIDEAKKSSILNNIFLNKFVVEIAEKYNVDLDKHYIEAIKEEINEYEQKVTSESSDNDIMYEAMIYNLGSKSIPGFSISKKKNLIRRFEELYIKLTMVEEIAIIMADNDCFINDETIRTEIRQNVEKNLQHSISHNRLYIIYGDDQGFEYLYYAINFLKL